MLKEEQLSNAIKCVVVGDSAVGKTRLICAKACGARVPPDLLASPAHKPTVWAIDQYRTQEEVFQRSLQTVDGIQVSLRLWDTFGAHDRDRHFSYDRAEVVLLCYSVGRRRSLASLGRFWLREVRRWCPPDTPVVLVACQNDLRDCHLRPAARFVKDQELVPPEDARALSRDLGAPYYETSALTGFGIQELFENVIRMALLRQKRNSFWIIPYKNVQPPQPQKPYCPQAPPCPSIRLADRPLLECLQDLREDLTGHDLELATGGATASCHVLMAAAASPRLAQLLDSGRPSPLDLTGIVPANLLDPLVMIFYSGEVEVLTDPLRKLLLDLQVVNQEVLSKVSRREGNQPIRLYDVGKRLHALQKADRYTDVTFFLADDKVRAHRQLLSARCDFFRAMFHDGHFLESQTGEVQLAHVGGDAMRRLLHFLYRDRAALCDPQLAAEELELARALLLPRFATLLEAGLIAAFSAAAPPASSVLGLLETCEVQGLENLLEWCLHFLCVRYELVERLERPLLRSLPPRLQAHLNRHRWPPKWYIKELDHWQFQINTASAKKKKWKFMS